jgi:type IV pilus assembly protein PilA
MRPCWLIRLLLLAAVILAAIALVPRRLGESDVFRSETRVLTTIRTIHTAETEYYSQYGLYAVTLRELAPLLDDTLASRVGTGYRFTLAEKRGGYIVSAVPRASDAGGHTFYSDETMVVREQSGPDPATATSPEFAK